ncbi:hypothetical protein [Streptomyces sp. NPDC059468]|uniref:hypothetical protein n=1 Tax=Streptomyces sp. NPDC059468 TaxID=3346845 RepID=UPI00367CE78A
MQPGRWAHNQTSKPKSNRRAGMPVLGLEVADQWEDNALLGVPYTAVTPNGSSQAAGRIGHGAP